MFSKTKFLAVFLLLLILVLRVFFFFAHAKPASNQELTGSVSTQPYARGDDLIFWIGQTKVKAVYADLSLGDKVVLAGKYEVDKEFVASRVKLIKADFLTSLSKNFRENLASRVSRYLPTREAGLLNGMVLGVKTSLQSDFKKSLISTGTIHVVVVSGFNVALVAGLAVYLASWIGRKKASLLGVLLIAFYIFVVGLSWPAIRAALMGTISLLAVLTGKKETPAYSLLLVGVVLVLLSPASLFDISFQLSFLATLSLICFNDYLRNKSTFLPRVFGDGFATTLAAQVLVIPIIFFYFGKISLLSPLVNALVIWLVPLTTMIGFVFIGAVLVSSILAQLIGYLIFIPLWLFSEVVIWFGKLTWFNLSLPQTSWFLLLGYYLIVLAASLQVLTNAHATKKV